MGNITGQGYAARSSSYESPGAAAGVGALKLASGFGDNGSSVVPIGATPTPLASVTVIPTKTGKFIVTGTAVLTNGDTQAAHFAKLGIGHGSTVDYNQSTGVSLMAQAGPIPSSNAYVESDAITVKYGSPTLPTTFPVGIAVKFVLFGTASIGGQVFVDTNQAQITVFELPS